MQLLWTEGSPVFVIDDYDEDNDDGISASFEKKEEEEVCRVDEMGVFQPT